MDKTFLGLLENHVQAIKTANSGKNANDVLLRTVKLLLDKIDASEICLADYDKIEMRKLFSSFGQVTQSACDFYRASKERLDPVALNGEIGRNLETTTKKIAEVTALMDSIEKNNAELLKEEKELNKKNEKYEKLKEEISTLKKIKETISDDVIKTLRCESAELNKTITQNRKMKSELDSEIKELKNTQQSLSVSTAKANTSKKIIEENITNIIDAKTDSIRKICEAHSKDFDCILAEIADFKRLYEQLPDERLKAESELDKYKLHFGENSGISNALRKHGVPSIDRFFDDLECRKNTIETELMEFDKLLRDILVEQERASKAIKERGGVSN